MHTASNTSRSSGNCSERRPAQRLASLQELESRAWKKKIGRSPGRPEKAFWLAPTLLLQEVGAEIIVAAIEREQMQLPEELVEVLELGKAGWRQNRNSSYWDSTHLFLCKIRPDCTSLLEYFQQHLWHSPPISNLPFGARICISFPLQRSAAMTDGHAFDLHWVSHCHSRSIAASIMMFPIFSHQALSLGSLDCKPDIEGCAVFGLSA